MERIAEAEKFNVLWGYKFFLSSFLKLIFPDSDCLKFL
jgi:hypothetical protein